MSEMKHDDEWHEGDATWELLGKAAPKEASRRFSDDTLRAVKLLPEADPWWPKVLSFSPLAGIAACAVVVSWMFLNHPDEKQTGTEVTVTNTEEKWGEIEDVAEVEMLSAAAEHLDQFSDQDLITMIGL